MIAVWVFCLSSWMLGTFRSYYLLVPTMNRNKLYSFKWIVYLSWCWAINKVQNRQHFPLRVARCGNESRGCAARVRRCGPRRLPTPRDGSACARCSISRIPLYSRRCASQTTGDRRATGGTTLTARAACGCGHSPTSSFASPCCRVAARTEHTPQCSGSQRSVCS